MVKSVQPARRSALGANRAALVSLAELASEPFRVEGPAGDPVFGDGEAAGDLRHPITHEGAIVGVVVGGRSGAAVARVIEALYARETEARALADETLARYKELKLLQALGDALARAASAAEVGAVVVEHTSRFLRASAVSLELLDPTARGALEVVARSGDRAPLRDDAVVARVLATHHAELLQASRPDETRVRSVIVAPFANDAGAFGVLVVESAPGAGWTAGQLELVASFAAGASSALGAIEARRREREALVSAADAQAEARVRSRFLATMSHEIRTPMNAVIGMTELLARTELTPKQRRHVDVVASSGRLLLALVDDILDLAKIEAGKLDLRSVELDVRELVAGVADLLGPRAQAKGLSFGWEVDARVPPTLTGDPDRLRQILVNLVGNALKFTERGEVAVRAEIGGETERDVELRVSVRDTGIGVAEEDRARLFDPFTQVEGPSRRPGGTGLGTTIAKQLAEAMGGAIGLESELGAGSTFWFTARLARVERTTKPAAASDPRRPPTATVGPRRSARLLVAEDNPTNQEVIVGMLAELGYVADVVSDGAQAVLALGRSRYAAVLMDCEMPVLNGYGAASEIRRIEAGRGRTPILALTAHAMAEHRDKAREAGMDDYLTKPLNLDALGAALARWVRVDVSEGAEPAAPKPPSASPASPASPAASKEAALRRIFAKHAPGQLAALRAAIAEGGAEAIADVAHQMKGGALMCGLTAAGEVAAAMEAAARAGRIDEVVAALPAMDRALAAALASGTVSR